MDAERNAEKSHSDETRWDSRRVLGMALLLILTILVWRDWPGMVLLTDRENRSWMFEHQFDGRDPDWAEALRYVEEHSDRGETIVLVMGPGEQAAIDFRHRRAEWILAGRNVVPLEQPDRVSLRSAAEEASFIITWRAIISADRFQQVSGTTQIQVLARR